MNAVRHSAFSPALAFGYSLLAYLAFQWSDFGGVLSLTFICLIPFVLGVLIVALAPYHYRTSSVYAIFAPWLPFSLLMLVVLVLQWELLICVCMAMPFYMLLSSTGGLVMMAIWQRREARERRGWYALAGLLVLPFIASTLEARISSPSTLENRVETSIFIEAKPEAIWGNMAAVPLIQDDEWGAGIYDVVSLPQPLKATLDHEGVGGVRNAIYENGLILQEPITIWQPYQRLAFEVIVDPDSPKPYNQVGGEMFAVQEVSFWLEPTDDGVTLHLASDYRLKTPFGVYGKFWMDLLLRDLQNHILEVIKTRSEAEVRQLH